MRAREHGITIGQLPTGARNSITDIKGVRVGHATIDTERNKTGVTVVMPSADNPYINKLVAASFVLNGFGKTQGLIQIDELGAIETPIALTNTLNIGLVHDALVEYAIRTCAEEGKRVTTVNPIVCECNDASLNDIQYRAVTQKHVFSAIENASETVTEGDVGCGKGTTCHGLKGGVGTSSRKIELTSGTYHIGALAQTNHGRLKDLTINGNAVGQEIYRHLHDNTPDKGSCIIIIATDLPVSSRQLRRIIKRAGVGLARLGSFWGHGSGDIFIGFTTANRIPDGKDEILPFHVLNESLLDIAFRAAAEATEEAVLNSMLMASTVAGFNGNVRESLETYLHHS